MVGKTQVFIHPFHVLLFSSWVTGNNPCCWKSVGAQNAKILPAFILFVAQMFDLQLSSLCGQLVVGTGIEVQIILQFSISHCVPSSREVVFSAILINEHLPSLNIFFDFRHLSSGFNLHWFCVSCLRQHHGKRTKIQSDEQYSPNNCWLTSFLQLRLVPLVFGVVKSFGCSTLSVRKF